MTSPAPRWVQQFIRFFFFFFFCPLLGSVRVLLARPVGRTLGVVAAVVLVHAAGYWEGCPATNRWPTSGGWTPGPSRWWWCSYRRAGRRSGFSRTSAGLTSGGSTSSSLIGATVPRGGVVAALHDRHTVSLVLAPAHHQVGHGSDAAGGDGGHGRRRRHRGGGRRTGAGRHRGGGPLGLRVRSLRSWSPRRPHQLVMDSASLKDVTLPGADSPGRTEVMMAVPWPILTPASSRKATSMR